MKLNIIYEDNTLLVVHKPAGLPAQTKQHSKKDLETEVRNYLLEKNDYKQTPYCAMIHRLDQPVEGLMLFAKTKQAAAILSADLNAQSSEKRYLAITKSPLPAKEGTLTNYLCKNPTTNTSYVSDDSQKNAKKAVLDYKLSAQSDGHYLYEIRLHTGRHHQIRVQLSHAGAPILGDNKYGQGEAGMQPALCAYRLTFLHPVTKKKMTFSTRPENTVFQIFTDIEQIL